MALGIDASKNFCETAASTKPGEGSFDDPSARQEFEPLGSIRTFDDFDRPFSEFGEFLF